MKSVHSLCIAYRHSRFYFASLFCIYFAFCINIRVQDFAENQFPGFTNKKTNKLFKKSNTTGDNEVV